ncbi:hypothetical protein [Nonomuraea sp. NPDC049480]|uniref:hypothetical protein n=1 Tax=Nonomuraea sp. NPDC049480 TaxID=3364353 RepID=UPI0037BC329B
MYLVTVSRTTEAFSRPHLAGHHLKVLRTAGLLCSKGDGIWVSCWNRHQTNSQTGELFTPLTETATHRH